MVERRGSRENRNNRDSNTTFLTVFGRRPKNKMEALALLNRDGHFVWVDDHAPWGWCSDLVLGTPAWQWVTSDNVERVKTAYSRCLVLHEPQQFTAEVSIDGRSVDIAVWLLPVGLEEVRIVAKSTRLPTRIRELTTTEREVLRLTGAGLAPKVIATRMNVERTTVDTHRRNIMSKLRIDNSHEFQAFAVRKRKLW